MYPARLHGYDMQPCPHAPANRQPTCPESGSLPVCFPALQERRRPPPLSECRFFAPSVRVRLSSMPYNPDATHSHHPRYPALAPVRGHCGSVCCRRRALRRHLHRPAFAALDALGASPEGHAQENAAGVRPSPGVAGFGSGLPGIPARTTATLPARQKRHSEIGPLKNRLQERVALRRHPSHSGPGLSSQR